MQMTGVYRIEASRTAVWAALNDPEIMRRCIPRCEKMVKLSETAFEARLKLKLGPLFARIKGDITLSDLNPPESYHIYGEGKGGVAGFAKGGARVRLDEDSGATLLTYDAEGQLGGKLARLGARLASGTARRLADAFFARFAELVQAQAAEAPEPVLSEPTAPAPEAAPPLPAQREPVTSNGAPTAVWVAGLIVSVLCLLAIVQWR